MNDESIFSEALSMDSSHERDEYLQQACQDEAQRQRIDELLASHKLSNSLLDRDLTGGVDAQGLVGSTIDALGVLGAKENQVGGSYRMLHLLGEGGMGSVYMAEQIQPVKRRVAVKIIKQGMNSEQFVARFEAERQALAMMDHPSIAKVLDAGCTQQKLPFFVMELVKGIPITEFCDQNKLGTEARLELFIQVCNAVQHAHQKGIIHRDLKPSNVMVAMYDDRPVPKVIDFGVAKATHQQLTEQTLYTVPGQIVGTWEYMSPEQAILNQLDVDTRTDIYSLGVILYELLTGHTPLDLKSLGSGALEERLRRIREEEPSRPSLRVSSLGADAGSLATYRGTEAKSLTQTLRGDLDWIVMKALEKDRSRRYETANGFAAEIRRFLSDEPISFRPPSSWEQFERLYRRHRVIGNAACAVMLALVAASLISLYAIRKTSHSLQIAHEAVYERLITVALTGDRERTKRLLSEARDTGLDAHKLSFAEAVDRFNADDPDLAIQLASKIPKDHEQFLAAQALIAASYANAGLDGEHIATLELVRGLDPPETAEECLFMSSAEIDRKKSFEHAEKAFEQRKSATALLAKAEALHLYANDSGNPELTRLGLDLITAAEAYLGETSHVLAVRLCTEHLLAKHASQGESDLLLDSANRTAERLSKSGLHSLSWVAPLYFFDTGQNTRAIEAWRGVDLTGNVLSQYIASLHLATFDDSEIALKKYDEIVGTDEENPWILLSRIPLMREHPVERRLVPEAIMRLRQATEARPEMQSLLIKEILDPVEQREYARQILQHADGRYEAWGMRNCIEFLAGEPTPERIQESIASAGNSDEIKCSIEFTVGWRLLQEPDRRAEAIEHFRSCLATDIWYYFDYNWAKAYLKKMEESDWPTWTEKSIAL
ncbi:MAG: serine/threonine protein kinase [Planctomycetales bacterium]|nr:serine/threonine protein kinase [Planctomycetales bacterium]